MPKGENKVRTTENIGASESNSDKAQSPKGKETGKGSAAEAQTHNRQMTKEEKVSKARSGAPPKRGRIAKLTMSFSVYRPSSRRACIRTAVETARARTSPERPSTTPSKRSVN